MMGITLGPQAVRDILSGSKRQLRRVVSPQPVIEEDGRMHWKGIGWTRHHERLMSGTMLDKCPYGRRGTQLWVREAWCRTMTTEVFPYEGTQRGILAYRATYDPEEELPAPIGDAWRPALHMPRWASRITLEVEDVRVEKEREVFMWVIGFKHLERSR